MQKLCLIIKIPSAKFSKGLLVECQLYFLSYPKLSRNSQIKLSIKAVPSDQSSLYSGVTSTYQYLKYSIFSKT